MPKVTLRQLPLYLAIIMLSFLSMATMAHATLSVSVSIPPQKNIVERIGGEHVNVSVLLPTGSDPHTFEPKPSQLRDMAKADLYVAIGMPFEDAWLHRLVDTSGGTIRVVEMHKNLVDHEHGAQCQHEGGHEQHAGGHALHVTEHGHAPHDTEHGHAPHDTEHGHAHHDHSQCGGPNDPHRWLSPMLMKHMALEVRKALVKADPANAPTYRANYAILARELADLDARLDSILNNIPKDRRRFMVFHPAWKYFAQNYGLEEIAIEVDGREPSPRQLMKVIDLAKEARIQTIFIQPQFSKRAAETIAKEIGKSVQLVEADPMAEDWDRSIERLAHLIAKDTLPPK